MIKNIFLHIGVHKTASTTIQNTLYTERAKLSDSGILYPAFKAGDIAISNHSIPFYSLFTEHPETFHFNVSHGFTTDKAIQQLHDEYRQQLTWQIAGFKGENLIISGEDISLLTTDELKKLKTYLHEITQPEVSVWVILMCRHPVSRFRSALQGSVCAFGMTMEKAIERNLRHKHLYRNLITVFSKVFGREHIVVRKYEDSVNHPFGPAGALLALVNEDLPDKIKLALLHDNPTRKYETFVLLNAINQTCYHTSGQELQPQRMVELNKLFGQMPGQKFMLPQNLSKKVWETLAEDVNWLCQEFSLPKYQFISEDLKSGVEIWNRQTLDYLRKAIPQLSLKYRKIILLEIVHQSVSKRNKIPFARRIKLLFFVLAQLKSIL